MDKKEIISAILTHQDIPEIVHAFFTEKKRYSDTEALGLFFHAMFQLLELADGSRYNIINSTLVKPNGEKLYFTRREHQFFLYIFSHFEELNRVGRIAEEFHSTPGAVRKSINELWAKMNHFLSPTVKVIDSGKVKVPGTKTNDYYYSITSLPGEDKMKKVLAVSKAQELLPREMRISSSITYDPSRMQFRISCFPAKEGHIFLLPSKLHQLLVEMILRRNTIYSFPQYQSDFVDFSSANAQDPTLNFRVEVSFLRDRLIELGLEKEYPIITVEGKGYSFLSIPEIKEVPRNQVTKIDKKVWYLRELGCFININTEEIILLAEDQRIIFNYLSLHQHQKFGLADLVRNIYHSQTTPHVLHMSLENMRVKFFEARKTFPQLSKVFRFYPEDLFGVEL